MMPMTIAITLMVMTRGRVVKSPSGEGSPSSLYIVQFLDLRAAKLTDQSELRASCELRANCELRALIHYTQHRVDLSTGDTLNSACLRGSSGDVLAAEAKSDEASGNPTQQVG